MGGYLNGRFPLSMFVHLGGNHYLPPGTAARWRWLVEQAEAKYGVRLRITGNTDGLGGWNGYRPYDAQVRYKAHYGRYAAAPGFSSHGGIYHGAEVFAIDVDNWGSLGRTTAEAWSRFQALCRLAGFRTDFVVPEERWHIGDFNDPWSVPTGSGGSESEEEDMTPEERRKLDEVHSMALEIRDYLGARGGHNTKTPDTIGHKVSEIRDYLGAANGKGTKTPNTLGYKINQLFERWAKSKPADG